MITNAISHLQEHCVQNGLPIPNYHFEDLTKPSTPSKFACHCKMGHISAVATASSKKEAKHDVAKKVMQKIGIDGANNNLNAVKTETVSSSSSSTVALDNPIGKLNEYCSKNRYMYPSYFEMGVRNGEFVVQCKHQSFVTEGLANNKKIAKQLAAYNMLVALNKTPSGRPQQVTTPENKVVSNPPDVIDRPERQYSDDEIIKLYHEIIKKRESVQKVEPVYTITDPFSPDVDLANIEVKEEKKTENVSLDDFESLEKQFKTLKLDYTIQVVSNEPLIMAMQVSDATFMDMGTTSEECKSKLFKTALNRYKEN